MRIPQATREVADHVRVVGQIELLQRLPVTADAAHPLHIEVTGGSVVGHTLSCHEPHPPLHRHRCGLPPAGNACSVAPRRTSLVRRTEPADLPTSTRVAP